MNDILEQYEYHKAVPSDINENLYILKELTEQCEHVTEFGVRWVVSTWAMLAGKPKRMISYDINYHINMEAPKVLARSANIEYECYIRNVLDTDLIIEQTDLLFIDTLHTYNQLTAELAKHACRVNKFLAFHDTETYGYTNEFGIISMPSGLMPAIEKFMMANPEWKLHTKKTNNNGFLVLEKVL